MTFQCKDGAARRTLRLQNEKSAHSSFSVTVIRFFFFSISQSLGQQLDFTRIKNTKLTTTTAVPSVPMTFCTCEWPFSRTARVSIYIQAPKLRLHSSGWGPFLLSITVIFPKEYNLRWTNNSSRIQFCVIHCRYIDTISCLAAADGTSSRKSR